MEASARAGDHVIHIGPGVYKLTGGPNEDMGVEGDFDLRVPSGDVKRVTIRGVGPPPLYCVRGCAYRDPSYSTTSVVPAAAIGYSTSRGARSSPSPIGSTLTF